MWVYGFPYCTLAIDEHRKAIREWILSTSYTISSPPPGVVPEQAGQVEEKRKVEHSSDCHFSCDTEFRHCTRLYCASLHRPCLSHDLNTCCGHTHHPFRSKCRSQVSCDGRDSSHNSCSGRCGHSWGPGDRPRWCQLAPHYLPDHVHPRLPARWSHSHPLTPDPVHCCSWSHAHSDHTHHRPEPGRGCVSALHTGPGGGCALNTAYDTSGDPTDDKHFGQAR